MRGKYVKKYGTIVVYKKNSYPFKIVLTVL